MNSFCIFLEASWISFACSWRPRQLEDSFLIFPTLALGSSPELWVIKMQTKILDGHPRSLFKRRISKEEWTLTIEDFDLRFDEHFESHLLINSCTTQINPPFGNKCFPLTLKLGSCEGTGTTRFSFLFCFVLLPHCYIANYVRNAHRWCAVIGKPGCAWLTGTPAIQVTCLYVSWYLRVVDTHSILKFLSFFLGVQRPNLITGLSGWRAPD